MQAANLNIISERMQQVLEREYGYLAWRILVQAESVAGAFAEPWLFVHARTRDFWYRCRIGRSRSAVL